MLDGMRPLFPLLLRKDKPWLSAFRSMIFLIIPLFVLLPETLKSQYFSLGYDPASLKWGRIKTEHFTVIFPKSFEPNAQYIANGFEHFYEPGSASLKARPMRFPIILHNQSVFSNAFVPYAPKRIEFLTTPPQDMNAQGWINDLILHEFRHAVQYGAVNRGFTKGLSYIIGQQALPAVIGLFVPFWFIEGDATISETVYSHSGRGRVPSFEMKLRAQFLEKGIYHYDKAVHGSYKDFTPDWYELGYQLVGRTRLEYGSDVWANTLEKVGKIPIMLVPFSQSLIKQTGYGKVQLYRHITSEMKEEWSEKDQQHATSDLQVLSPSSASYTTYRHAVVLQDGSILAIRESLDDIARIVRISDGREEILITPGTGFQRDALSASHSLVCWGEAMPDPRWPLRDYAVIKTYDMTMGKIRQITHKSRLFAPSVSHQGDRIVAAEVTADDRNYLVILDAHDGSEIKRTFTGDNLFFMQPAWSEDGKKVASIVIGKKGKSLLIWDVERDTVSFALPFTFTEMSRPVFIGDQVYLSGAWSGTDDIYSVDIQTGGLVRLTSARFGAADPAINKAGDSLYYSNYTSDGYQIAGLPLGETLRTTQAADQEPRFLLAEQLAKQEGFIYDPDSVPDYTYPVKPYRKGLNLFNFHSWAPLSLDADNLDVKPGVMLMSQNLLGTSYTTLGYEYDLNEQAGKYYMSFSYNGLFPAFDLGMDYGLRRGVHQDDNDSITNFKYHELNVPGGVSLPLSWSVSSWYMGANPRIGYAYKYLKMDPESGLQFKYDRINALDYRFFYYAQHKTSYRDLQPPWGQLVEINYKHTVSDQTTSGNSIFSSEVLAYFPGFFRHQGLRVYAGYQDRIWDYYLFSNLINTARGYSGLSGDRMMTLTGTYVFPLFYPDWRLGPVLYLKRLKGAVFYDHTVLMDDSPYGYANTIGLDLSIDFHLLSFLAPIEVGLRSMYMPADASFGFEFLWGVNFDSLY